MDPIEENVPETVHRPLNYKKIGIILAILVIVAVLVSIFVPHEPAFNEIRDTGQAVVTDGIRNSEPGQEQKEYSIRVMNNKVVIYSDDSAAYEETNIRVKDLPVQEQERVKAGSYLVDEAALYDFLESYTS